MIKGSGFRVNKTNYLEIIDRSFVVRGNNLIIVRSFLFAVADKPLPNEQTSIPVVAPNSQANPPPYVEPPKIQNPVLQPKVHDNRLDNIQAVYQQNIPGYQQPQLYQCGIPCNNNVNMGQFQSNQQQQQFYQKVNNLASRRLTNPHQIASLQTQQKKNQQFFTMPNRRPVIRELNESPRSITSDATRSLVRGPPHSMQTMKGPAYPIANKLMMYPQNVHVTPSERMMNFQNLEMSNMKYSGNNPSQLIRPQNPAIMEIKSR